MKADFSGWATKAGLLCSDGRTIMPGAFKHQDMVTVPLVWQHGHSDPENVLGHVTLEHREDGVYAHAYFNSSQKAVHAKELVEHKDITQLSIWANQLVERGKKVLHGAIREVSLVLSGANPGAQIENVTIHHSDGDDLTLEDEAIIFTGNDISLEHADADDDNDDTAGERAPEEMLQHDDENSNDDDEDLQHANDDDKTVEDIYNSMTKEQKDVLHYMVGEALAAAKGDAKHSDLEFEDAEVKEVFESMTEDQQEVVVHMLDAAIEDTMSAFENTNQEGNEMTHNVFEQGEKPASQALSHEDVKGIVADATRSGSLKDAVEGYALQHNITDIDILFPDAQKLMAQPELFKRRTEWVSTLLGGARKSPFSRIKTLHADITVDEARAKGYVKGNLKKEEFFAVTKRVTIPTTIYKKQKLDRDDMIDINDFDVVAWLKAEMRVMLDEEIARAVLIGDGRDVAHEDKINEGNIRPISKDHEVYTTTINVNVDDANSNFQEVIDAVVENRGQFRGTGMPIFFTTETYIAKALLLKDTLGRRIYKNLEELASELRVTAIVPVEAMEDESDLVAVIVNPSDYVVGSDKGGQVSMFDDFDIDYNQYKYLIETRLSGALVKMKSAMVVRKVASSLVLVAPAEPGWDPSTGNVTITDQTGVVYYDASDDSIMNNAGSPYAVVDGTSIEIYALADTGYYLGAPANWRYYYDAVG